MVTRILGDRVSTTATRPIVIKLGGRALDQSTGLAEFAAELRGYPRAVVLVLAS
ncbi:MAG: hypothetical protein FD129_1226 [bacterium]|nr:MAG: hypothetical protein FD129_1226 [bacterium]